MTGNQNRTCIGAATTVTAVVALFATVEIAAAGTLQFEEHEVQAKVEPFDFGETFFTSTSVPLFDTLGGTRQLEEVVFEWQVSFDWEAEINSTPTASNVQMQWETQWAAEMPGGLQIPTSDTQTLLSEHVFANDAGGPFYSESGTDSIAGGETVNSSTYLTAMTGSGTFEMEHLFFLSALSASDPGEPGFDFDPDMAQVFGLSIYTDMRIEYRYSTVPAPGALAALSLGFISIRRRRRSRDA